MFLSLNLHQLTVLPALRHSMFADRAGQFVDRHRWPLRLDDEGLEVDDYDDGVATYCIVAAGGHHLASVRLRPVRSGSMTEDHFPGLWREALRSGVEITRFCCAPDLSPDQRLSAVSDLLLGLCRHCQASGIVGIFGIVFPAVARVIRQAGWPSNILGEIRDQRGTMVLTQWTPGDLVAWDIQEKRELREEIWTRRRERAQIEMLVA